MEIRLHDDLATFAELAAPLLYADPVRHTIAASQLAARLRPGAPDDIAIMGTVHGDDAAVVGAVLGMRGLSLIVSALPPEAAPAVAEALAERDVRLPGATGPLENAEEFAATWCRRTGASVRVAMPMRLFALGELRPPAGVGAARLADLDDVALLARWRDDFAAAALPPSSPRPDDQQATVARQLAAGQGNLLWEVGDEPVAVAAASVPAAKMSRIAAVWTPPELRGRGFGSAVTAAASRWALEAGARHVVLFTDLTNLVSNSIYPKLGYRPVHDAVDLSFDGP